MISVAKWSHTTFRCVDFLFAQTAVTGVEPRQEQLIHVGSARSSSSLGSSSFNVYGEKVVCGVTVMIHDVMATPCNS